MDDNDSQIFIFKPMSRRTFSLFADFIQSELGIKMPESKRTMIQTRLRKRMRSLGIVSYDDYYDYVFSPEGKGTELLHMIDAVTTNKTDFFREPVHFDYLSDMVLPEFARTRGEAAKLRIWSAGCSSGEEAYTIAIVLNEYREKNSRLTYSIYATDISVKSLKKGIMGIYEEERVAPIPMDLRKKYLLRSKNREKKVVRVTPVLRSVVKFQRMNFMDNEYRFNQKFDVVFFRNVLIYFDRPTQEAVLLKICRCMRQGAYLFSGHSETLSGMKLPLEPVASTVYRRTSAFVST